MNKTKVCPRCKRELSTDAYYHISRSNGTTHISVYCKECIKEMTKEYRNSKKKAAPKPEAPAKATPVTSEQAAENHMHKIYTHKDLAKFQPRDLMLELKARGYVGEQVFREVIVKEHRINLDKLN